MAKETHIKTDKKPVGGWGAWELPLTQDSNALNRGVTNS